MIEVIYVHRLPLGVTTLTYYNIVNLKLFRPSASSCDGSALWYPRIDKTRYFRSVRLAVMGVSYGAHNVLK